MRIEFVKWNALNDTLPSHNGDRFLGQYLLPSKISTTSRNVLSSVFVYLENASITVYLTEKFAQCDVYKSEEMNEMVSENTCSSVTTTTTTTSFICMTINFTVLQKHKTN